MNLSNSLDAIFRKFPSGVESVDSCIINETQHDATMKKLEIESKGNSFVAYGERFPRFVNISLKSFKSDACDGTVFMESPDGVITFIFSELKSQFDTIKITEAFSQIMLSFVKAHSILSLCEGYNLRDCKLIFLVACKTFENKEKEDAVYELIRKANIAQTDTLENKYLYRLLKNGRVKTTVRDLKSFANAPFSIEMKDKEVELALALTTNYNDSSVTFSM